MAAVTLLGASTVNSLSTIASLGISTSPFKSIFICFFESVITVNLVASLPVPAVVGIAASGKISPVISFPLKSAILPSFTAIAAIAFAESRGLPPPIPIIKSQSDSLSIFTPLFIITSSGSPVMPLKITYPIPSSSSNAVSFFIISETAMCLPVTIKAFLPISFKSGAASLSTPLPTTM